ncbi:potassium-transporting ATPase subunit KdpC [Pelomonas aquatica]|jgi:K+-transporting ATPase ATPase C chain|uniref:Potassium-transporting ATPase KdpC subunit n=1 Tax=Pelomonas aquatica TaxID=431058 RepID=A0A9X4R5L0_9BURK|nr:potassium-transporting ATPase subunit KdpC [Pelomonas aquatica]MCY4756664.1 potassium-transporting ATPase subunit KdpC [Pelomonas aquatica]MDG0863801.1 potassium-transporting ATPase subunit KdpC [Pelomonas aquatica]
MTTTLSTPPAASAATAEVPLWRPALTLFVVLSLVTGLAYPLVVTGVAQGLFPDEANGSLVARDGKPVGSTLIGQTFADPGHFWSRPSATGPMPYNAGNSSGSNLAPTAPALADAVKARIQALRAADPGNMLPVPVDLVTTSASGLDPHISRAAADYQLARVARVRGLPVAKLRALVEQHTEGRWLGFIGEPRVNVLRLNLALDALPHA